MTSGQMHVNGTSAHLEMAGNDQEMVRKGGRRWTVGLLVGVLVIAGLAGAVAFLLRSRPADLLISNQDRLREQPAVSLQQILRGELAYNRFNATWISDSELLYRREDGSYWIYNAKKRAPRMILTPENEVIRNAFQYELSADQRYLMIAHSYQKLYRHTFLAYYHIVDLENRRSWPLRDVNGSQMLVQLVVWAPKDNAFAYVYVNDIYYRTSAREAPVNEYRLTQTGRPSNLYNGVPDWVYEEEVLSSNKALWFSEDGHHIAYATFNDSQTPVMNIPYYGSPGDLRYQYTQAVNIRYPKPGRPNPVVSLHAVDLIDLHYKKQATTLDIPSTNFKEPVLSQVSWSPKNELFVLWMNRVQNQAKGILCFVDSTKCIEVLQMEEKEGWVEMGEVVWSGDGGKIAYVGPGVGQGAGYRQVTVLDVRQARDAKHPRTPLVLTSANATVTDILHWDQASQHIYYATTVEGHPEESRVNRVTAVPGAGPPECVTCSEPCSYSAASLSPKGSFMAVTCAGPQVPTISIYTKDGKKVVTWEENVRLKAKLKGRVLPTTKYLTVPVAEGMDARVKLYLPPGYDPSGNTKYPLVVQVYGGPGSVQVSERFAIDWYSYLVVNKSLVYAMIDGRGSGLKGDAMMFANYRRLGTTEIQDQITVTRVLQESEKYIDKKRTAIWGWSYGGYATGMALANDTDGVFQCGISVAPVTDWLLYDTLYTERYMGLPNSGDNMKGYEAAALNNKVNRLRGKKFLLVHGTLDDNVHYQQSMMLAKALELADIMFQQQSYPDEGHGLTDVRPHLYHTLGNFLEECFNQD